MQQLREQWGGDRSYHNKPKSARMSVLRVSAVGPGETPPMNNAINREQGEPPRINKKMRRAKLNLAVDLTIKLCLFDEPWIEDLLAVWY
jgi:hypothetical protein